MNWLSWLLFPFLLLPTVLGVVLLVLRDSYRHRVMLRQQAWQAHNVTVEEADTGGYQVVE